jgi:hypothetical protein
MVDIGNGIPSGFLQKVWRTKANCKRMVGLEAGEAHVSSKIVRVFGQSLGTLQKTWKDYQVCHQAVMQKSSANDMRQTCPRLQENSITEGYSNYSIAHTKDCQKGLEQIRAAKKLEWHKTVQQDCGKRAQESCRKVCPRGGEHDNTVWRESAKKHGRIVRSERIWQNSASQECSSMAKRMSKSMAKSMAKECSNRVPPQPYGKRWHKTAINRLQKSTTKAKDYSKRVWRRRAKD